MGISLLALACVDELTTKRAWWAVETEQVKVTHNTLAARIRELKVTAGTRDGELRVMVWGMWSLKDRVAAGEDRA